MFVCGRWCGANEGFVHEQKGMLRNLILCWVLLQWAALEEHRSNGRTFSQTLSLKLSLET